MNRCSAIALLATAAVSAAAPTGASALRTAYLYDLSTLTGFLPLSGASLSYDDQHNELFVLGEGGVVRVFNQSGLETFTFGDDPAVGSIMSVAALENGDLLALTYLEGRTTLLRCNFRGEPLGRLELKGVPAAQADFTPGKLRVAAGRTYLADLAAMKVLVADVGGTFVRFFDIGPMVEVEDGARQDFGLKGFDVDAAGNILFTIQPLFHAYVLSMNGELRTFGQRGGGPGKFNVVAGITSDARGNLYVADQLKSAVIVFDKDLRFVREFGYRGDGENNLVVPVHVAVGGDKLFVSQYARHGVSVFDLQYD